MITRELKLKPTKKQEEKINLMLFQCAGLYNTVIRRIELNAKDKIYHSKFDLYHQFSGHSKRADLPAVVIKATVEQAYDAWGRCFKGISGKPVLKSVRNKTRTIGYQGTISRRKFTDLNRINLPLMSSIKFHKQELPDGNIKCSRIVKKSTGYYLQLTIDAVHKFEVKDTVEKVGIDTGFKHLAVLSNGIKYENQRNFVKGQKRLAQAQRGHNKKLVGRIYEKIANRRKDYNHKVSKEIVQNYKEIYITNDNLKGQARRFGKSVGDAGISQLRTFILYKSGNHGRVAKLVNSNNTTMTCSCCGALTGPTGLSMLAVRGWVCSACRAQHDRDTNAGQNVLNFGLGISLVQLKQTG